MSPHKLFCLLAVILFYASNYSEVEAGKNKRRNFRNRGYLIVYSMTDGAKLYINGKLYGKTPFQKPIPLRPGTHKLKATKAGHSILELQVVIRPRRKTEVQIDLLPHSGIIKIDCNIRGAEVYLDNNLIGHTPLIQEILVGDHTINIIKEGYNDFTSNINVKAGKKLFVQGQLTPFNNFSAEVMVMVQAQKEKQEKNASLTPNQLTPDNKAKPTPAWYSDFYKRWWFWTIAGTIVLTAVAVPLALSGGEQSGRYDHNALWESQLP